MVDHNNIFDDDGVIPPPAPDPWNDNVKLRTALDHWRHEVGKLHSQVDRLKHDRAVGAKDYCVMMERHDAAVVELARLTQINTDLTAANAALMVRVEEARKVLAWHADDTSSQGDLARAWLAGGEE